MNVYILGKEILYKNKEWVLFIFIYKKNKQKYLKRIRTGKTDDAYKNHWKCIFFLDVGILISRVTKQFFYIYA